MQKSRMKTLEKIKSNINFRIYKYSNAENLLKIFILSYTEKLRL